jgi:hypothetical protein
MNRVASTFWIYVAKVTHGFVILKAQMQEILNSE